MTRLLHRLKAGGLAEAVAKRNIPSWNILLNFATASGPLWLSPRDAGCGLAVWTARDMGAFPSTGRGRGRTVSPMKSPTAHYGQANGLCTTVTTSGASIQTISMPGTSSTTHGTWCIAGSTAVRTSLIVPVDMNTQRQTHFSVPTREGAYA